MQKLREILDKQAPGAMFSVKARDLGLDDEAFHRLAMDWLEQGLDGFTVDDTPHRESSSAFHRIDMIWLRRDAD